jgi:hypothetical protein
MSPFDFLNAINDTKVNVMVDDIAEKQYLPFIVNRGLSYFLETVLYANEMNQNYHLDKRLQFDYLINSVSRKRRFSKWLKPTESADLLIVKEHYGYNNEKARSALTLLSSEQINELKKQHFKGGHSQIKQPKR